MIYFDANNETIDKIVKRFCAPLFATERFMRGGHSETATNATVTFVQYDSRIYAVTCHHVLAAFWAQSLKNARQIVPSVHTGQSIYQFGSYSQQGNYRWAFLSCRDFLAAADIYDQNAWAALERTNSDKPDIAIAELTEIWPSFQSARNAEAINLDAWIEPDWSIAQPSWLAYGFPDAHKFRAGDKVSAPMPRVAVELSSTPPTSSKPTYILSSTLDADHGWGFSGLSGGPVLIAHKSKDRYAFVGITYEGAPSCIDLEENAESFLGKKDLVLMGYHLTPERFQQWLSQRHYGAEYLRE